MTQHEFNITKALEFAYSKLTGPLHYISLLARHAAFAQPLLVEDPGPESLEFKFETDNADLPRLARENFVIEAVRYALIYAMAHFDRFVLDIAVWDAVTNAASMAGRLMPVETAQKIEREVRTVHRNKSVVAELDRLAIAPNENVAVGIGWFRGLYAIRNCLVHRAGIVGPEDKKLLAGITWGKFVLTVDGEDAGPLPLHVDAGSTVGVRFAEATRTWMIGQHIGISLTELQEMLWSLHRLGGILFKDLNAEFTVRLNADSAVTPVDP